MTQRYASARFVKTKPRHHCLLGPSLPKILRKKYHIIFRCSLSVVVSCRFYGNCCAQKVNHLFCSSPQKSTRVPPIFC